MPTPLVAIIGRPNVGKSTLFNRLVGRREAIVSDVPGTTRDRLFAKISWNGQQFILVDTGGLEPRPQDPIREKVQAQVEVAIAEAAVVIFLLDGIEGLTPIDEEIARRLRGIHKPLIVAVNKVDNEKREMTAAEFYKLGLGEPILISAYHNTGVNDLMERVISLLPFNAAELGLAEEARLEPSEASYELAGGPALSLVEGPTGTMKLAILGRTNVGKSMLLNAILGEERAIVSEIPGTTRDALDTYFTYDGQPVLLVDTAGIRRRGRVDKGIEYYSVLRALGALERCDIALLVVDAKEQATAQDIHIAGQVWEAYKGLVVVFNKWDLVDKKSGLEQETYIQTIRQRLHFAPYIPICFTSALLGDGIGDLMAISMELYKERSKRVHPRELNRALMKAVAEHAPPSAGRRGLKKFGVRQVDVNPPTFIFTVGNPALLHLSYRRYLENRLRSEFAFTHTHLRLIFKEVKES